MNSVASFWCRYLFFKDRRLHDTETAPRTGIFSTQSQARRKTFDPNQGWHGHFAVLMRGPATTLLAKRTGRSSSTISGDRRH